MLSRLGILGGTFDPPHRGHLTLALRAISELELDELWLVVARHPYHKESVTSFTHRLGMARELAAEHPKIVASDVEAGSDGPSYTVDLLQQLAGPSRELFFCCGSDVPGQLTSWKDPQRCLDLATFVTIDRPADGTGTILPPNLRGTLVVLPGSSIQASSTRARSGDHSQLTAGVVRYVQEHGLYVP